MLKKTLICIFTFMLMGCGAHTAHFTKKGTNTSEVSFNVELERDFIQGISSLSGGQAAMLILIGPFTNNAVLLVAEHRTETGQEIAFRQRLRWGRSAFDVPMEKGKSYDLAVVVQGTRSGTKGIGQIIVKDAPSQGVNIQLEGAGVNISQI